MLYAMADNNVVIPAERDGALYNFLMGGQDYVFANIGDAFEITPSSTSFLITLGTGEGVVSGRHITEETVNGANSMIQLDANSSGYVVIRVDLTRPVGTEAFLYATPVLSAQDLNNNGTVHDLPLYQYTTNASGVSSFTDVRPLSNGSNVVCLLENGTIYVEQWNNGVKTRKQVGSLDPDVLTATPSDVKRGKTFGGANSDEPLVGTFTEQTKTVSPARTSQTVTADEGYYLTSVTVTAMSGYGVKGGNQVINLGTSRSAYYYATVYNGVAKVQGSNNNSSWADLRTVTAPGSSGGFAGGIASGSGTASYQYFRISLSGYNNGQTGDCALVVF